MEFKCNICNKQYASYQSIWNHNKKFHIDLSTQLHIPSTKSPHSSTLNSTVNKYCCKFCKKKLSRSDSVKRHELKCDKKIDIMNENGKLKNENSNLIEVLKNKL